MTTDDQPPQPAWPRAPCPIPTASNAVEARVGILQAPLALLQGRALSAQRVGAPGVQREVALHEYLVMMHDVPCIAGSELPVRACAS